MHTVYIPVQINRKGEQIKITDNILFSKLKREILNLPVKV